MIRLVNLIVIILFCLSSTYAFGQSTVGLIAHWKFNGNAGDSSGNGHHGHMTAVTPAVGRDGVPGHAYYFNGSTSKVTVPYAPDLNLIKYSICATVKVQGFYSGPCALNTILLRGKTNGGVGTYSLYFSDYPTSAGCTHFDSSSEVFVTGAGDYPGVSPASYDYTPHIIKDVWYTVVGTFNDTTFKMYVNGVLKATETVASPGPLNSGLDSISIGYNVFEPGWPYQMKGVIDDIRIYNRALSDTEIIQYADTCGQIIAHPSDALAAVGGSTTFTATTSITTPSYQWQVDMGTGFTNLTASGPYSGVFTGTLTVTGVTATMNGYHYRCMISNESSCSATTSAALLSVSLGIGADNTLADGSMVQVFPNPASGNITVMLPLHNDHSAIEIIDVTGRLVFSEKLDSAKNRLDISALVAGVYTARVYLNDHQVVYKRIVKM